MIKSKKNYVNSSSASPSASSVESISSKHGSKGHDMDWATDEGKKPIKIRYVNEVFTVIMLVDR